MKFVFAGGAREVGGSCIYIRTGGKGILLDCGIRQGANKDPLPDFASVQAAGGVDAIIVSHAHMDHTGSLPVISKEYPAAPIYMTSMTVDLTRILLNDSVKLMDRDPESIPFYGEDDVNAMLERVVPVPFQLEYTIFPGISFTLYPAGHIAGAACVFLKTTEGSVFYSGDVSSFAQQTIEGARLPKLRPDIGIFESTYGNRLHSNREAEEQRLIETVAGCVQMGEKVLIPAFALGRSQEVLVLLQRAMNRGALPAVPVYVDGMVRDMTIAYKKNPHFLRAALARKIEKGQDPFYNDNIQPVPRDVDRAALVQQPGPAVFVSSSGMLTGGPSVEYAKALVPREDACVIITGYQDEEAPGRLLLDMMEESKTQESKTQEDDAEESKTQEGKTQEDKTQEGKAGESRTQESQRKVSIGGTLLPLRAKVVQVGLSAHSDKSELLAMIDLLSCRRIILVHGDAEAMDTLGSSLSEDYRVRVYEPQVGASLDIEVTKQRRQIAQGFTVTMQGTAFADPAEQKALYDFWQEHYPYRTFTAVELYTLYTGCVVHPESMRQEEKDALDQFAQTLEDACYFTRDARRMFLFRRRTQEEIEELAKEDAPQMQDVETKLRGMWEEPPIRKLSFYQDRKLVRISVDYPDTVPEQQVAAVDEALADQFGWHCVLNPSPNFQAMGMLASSLFQGRIRKSSYYGDRKIYVLELKSPAKDGDRDKQAQFAAQTGWKLMLAGQAAEAAGAAYMAGAASPAGMSDAMVQAKGRTQKTWGTDERQETPGQQEPGSTAPSPGSPDDRPVKEPMDQHHASVLINQLFRGSEVKPYKISVRSDSVGRYLDLAFLSPALGERCLDILTKCARETGWRVHISNSVNMAQITQILRQLCDKYGVSLRKNPSYRPQEQVFELPTDDALPEALIEESRTLTGLTVRRKF